ncbi:MAG: tRNA uridine-5-carboxymethylaminomethyl(34) synthesis GTPase MnmE [Deltaproteobacteria bacterium]|nr:tRNA uridine-5-carboxymethylaminomethyl(34) synthesis GTPase MnmE [Deltaproteobacteria bacterium]
MGFLSHSPFPMPYDHLRKDTIAAIATPIGQAGIGIIRVSGPEAPRIAEKIFRPGKATRALESRRLYLGHLLDPSTGALIDEVLLTVMRAPHTFTREDVLEIHSHSGTLLLSRILRMILGENVRLAEPGEFTFRAYMNGRIDLTQAEAIIDLINAKSERGLQLASQQIRGGFKKDVEGLRQTAITILAQLEVAIDFPEEEDGAFQGEEIALRVKEGLIQPIEEIMATHMQRKIWVDGIQTVIAGCVNVGKSSLLNRLLNEERAIVTPIPGTTRDIIESTIHIKGIPLRLMDTAGFREVEGEVEKIGIRLAEQKLAEADLSLIVLDQSRFLNDEDLDIIARGKKGKSLILLNKIDLPSMVDENALASAADGIPLVKISALTGEGMEDLCQAIEDAVVAGEGDLGTPQVVPNLRHQKALNDAVIFFNKATANTREDLPVEIIAVDLQSGLDALGEITGANATDEVLERIFSEFCLGK